MSTQRRTSSPEDDVVQFFTDQEPAVALLLFRIVRGILERRGVFKAEPRTSTKRARPVRRTSPLLDDTVHQTTAPHA